MNTKHMVDARGLSCPQPVLETKRALELDQLNEFIVLVDNYTAKENVARFARNQGCDVDIEENSPTDIKVNITKNGSPKSLEHAEALLACPAPEIAPQPSSADRVLVYIGSNAMGSGDNELGQKLIRGFLRTLLEAPLLPWRIIFINSGVKLGSLDDEAVEAISLLEQKGVEILSCGACLEHFNLKNSLRVGRVTNMFEVIESLSKASKVISPD